MELQNLLERCQKAGLFNDNQYVVSAMNGIGHMDKIVQSSKKITFLEERL